MKVWPRCVRCGIQLVADMCDAESTNERRLTPAIDCSKPPSRTRGLRRTCLHIRTLQSYRQIIDNQTQLHLHRIIGEETGSCSPVGSSAYQDINIHLPRRCCQNIHVADRYTLRARDDSKLERTVINHYRLWKLRVLRLNEWKGQRWDPSFPVAHDHLPNRNPLVRLAHQELPSSSSRRSLYRKYFPYTEFDQSSPVPRIMIRS